MPGEHHKGPTLFDPERITKAYSNALAIADYEVRRRGHVRAEPEHLFLGVLGTNGVASAALHNAGISLMPTVLRIERKLPQGDMDWYPARTPRADDAEPFRPRFVGYSTAAKDTLEASFALANELGHERVSTAHLLSALIDGSPRRTIAVLTQGGTHSLDAIKDEALANHESED